MAIGRDREVREIVRYRRAAAVGQLMLGELDGPIEPVFADQYIDRPRQELRELRANIRASLRGEIGKFCRNNFEDLGPEDLSKLYEPLFEHGSNWHLPAVEFERSYGRFRPGILKGAPLHATIHISPWGLQTEFPEMHLVKDLAVQFNETLGIDDEIRARPLTSWRQLKDQRQRAEIAHLMRRRQAFSRSCVLSCFNLIEAYVNGLSWDYVQTHDISGLSNKSRQVITDADGQFSVRDRLVKIPRIVAGQGTGPLHETREPLKTFLNVVKPYRDSIVHASPYAAPERFGGYDKLNKIYDLNTATVKVAVDVTIEVIGVIHRFIGGDGEMPAWMPARADDGKFILDPDS